MKVRAFVRFTLYVLGIASAPALLDAVLALSALVPPLLAVGGDTPRYLTAGPAMELLTGFVTAPSTTFTAWTLASGNSLQIRNCEMVKKVLLLQAWADNQAAGSLRIRSPKLHDMVQGIRLGVVASEVQPLLPLRTPQRLFPQDILTVDQTGSAVAGDIETGCLLVYYEDLPGTMARFITPDQLMKRGTNVEAVENTIATGTAGGYSGQEAINAEFDLMKANTDYALLGYQVSAECAAIRWLGADIGNLGIGGPGTEVMKHLTGNWFVRLSEQFGLPLIPVFNSANKQGILIDAAQDENGADVTVNSIFVELAPQ